MGKCRALPVRYLVVAPGTGVTNTVGRRRCRGSGVPFHKVQIQGPVNLGSQVPVQLSASGVSLLRVTLASCPGSCQAFCLAFLHPIPVIFKHVRSHFSSVSFSSSPLHRGHMQVLPRVSKARPPRPLAHSAPALLALLLLRRAGRQAPAFRALATGTLTGPFFPQISPPAHVWSCHLLHEASPDTLPNAAATPSCPPGLALLALRIPFFHPPLALATI